MSRPDQQMKGGRSSTTWIPKTTQTRHQRIHLPAASNLLWACILLCLVLVKSTLAMDMTYCSSQNTGSTPTNTTIYQSDGLCFDFCKQDYAFAVVQWQSCWCSDYVPAEQLDTSECQDSCPGYPSDVCGNRAKDYYGYISLPFVGPSGTQGSTLPTSTVRSTADAPSSSTIVPSISTISSIVISSVVVQVPTTVTVQPTVETDTSTSEPSTSSTDSSTNTPTTDSSTSTSTTPSSTLASPSSTWTPTPVTSVITLTGQPQTITLTPSSPTQYAPSSSATSSVPLNDTTKASFFSNAGRAAGVFTVIALVVLAIIALCFFLIFRRRRDSASYYNDNNEGGRDPASPTISNGTAQSGPFRKNRSMSTLGLAGPFTSDKAAPSVHTTASPGMPSSLFSPERLTDQRLDPQQVWMRFENDNSSRVSIRSLRDDQDYSRRVLKVLNPDD